jgi:DNA methylase
MSGHMLDGHLRVELALERGEPFLDVTYVELSPEEERLVLASFDPLGAMADGDAATLATLIADLSPDDAGLAAMLDELARDHAIPRSGQADPDEAPPLPEPAGLGVHPGDVFDLGDHRLACGDASDPAVVATVMAGERASCVWSDPPWGIGYSGKTPRHLTIANDDPAGSVALLRVVLRAAPLEPNAPFYLVAPSGSRLPGFVGAITDAGWRLAQELVWVKDRPSFGRSDWQVAHESILYGHAPGRGRVGRGRHPETRWFGDDRQSSVLSYPRPAASRDHPTAKPVGLVAQCLANSTRPGDLVYEPFAGSGSTLIAAELTGRRCAAIEIDPGYVAVILERWEAFTGHKAARRG